MLDVIIIWDLPDDPDGNVWHIPEHDITPDEVEDVLRDRDSEDAFSRSSGRPITFGYTARDVISPWYGNTLMTIH